ncbi:major facilitator superfamily protein [Paenibacillus alvei TS-15]|uniref:Major facilitator superfamily protein n=1 Tax=Paenibacillus alvei TS-15 TaxID=1117108 RepID=S9SGL3_PAEAL|nr:MFS transporter [Paenibacillus alvei]EPY03889.1 major facilitator superfamily protein [Paenibacillus alvei TS-15]
MENTSEPKKRLWTLNFFLLWQGQLVSALGDSIYEIALTFWILYETGSPGLMGALLAASLLPKVLISPFAGVIVDRTDRRKMILLMDFIRGVCILFVGTAAIFGYLEIWMAFAAGIILGICAAFFNPAVTSTIPDLVHPSQIVQASANLSMLRAVSQIIGPSSGGVLYHLVGPPILFLCNGISYIISFILAFFMKIPKSTGQDQQYNFWQDMKDGFTYIWKMKGLRDLIVLAGFLNFFATISIVLLAPMFKNSANLGEVKYGIAMAIFTLGMLAGMILTSVFRIKPEHKSMFLMFSGLLAGIVFSTAVMMNNFILMAILLFIGGIFNAIVNVLIESTVQLTVTQEMRGKVSSIKGTLTMGLAPLAMFIGGILGEFFPIKYIVFSGFMSISVMFIPLFFLKSFKTFIQYNPEQQKVGL